MIAYLIKMVLCSLFLYIVYLLLLENENMHRFKRKYLLISLVVSLTAPLIKINIAMPQIADVVTMFTPLINDADKFDVESGMLISSNPVFIKTAVDYLPIVLFIEILISSFLILRIIINTFHLVSKNKRGVRYYYSGFQIVLIDENISPHSFGKSVFINKADYESGNIPSEILIHELAHIKQKHFLDIYFIELLIALFWFNPMFYLFRNKIKMNHEFLADEAVIEKTKDVCSYQNLLIKTISQRDIGLISSFNYFITKKRLIMITKKTSFKRVLLKKILVIPAFVAVVCIFSTKINAQISTSVTSESNSNDTVLITVVDQNMVITPSQGVGSEELAEYKQIEEKYLESDSGTEVKWKTYNLTSEERDRLYILYTQMTDDQRKQQRIGFMSPLTPMKRGYPNKDEWWTCKSKEHIMFDNKMSDKSLLDKYDRKSIVFFTYNHKKTHHFYGLKKVMMNI